MTASRQAAIVVILLVAVGAGWLSYERGWFRGGAPAGQSTSAQGGPGQASDANQAGTRSNGAGGGPPGVGGPPSRGGPVLVVTDAVQTDSSGMEVRSVGTLAAVKAVTLFPQVTGVVTDVAFTSGSAVADGQPLLRLDDADQQVAVQKAQIAVNDAQSAYDRTVKLAQSNSVTTVAVGDAKTALDKANIDLKSAQLELAKRTLNAPFAGTVGLSDINVGDLVSSQKAITTIDDMSTVTVSFTVPERASGIVAVGNEVTGTTDALAGQKFTGRVSAVDSRVDPTTRELEVEATLPNTANDLKPGMALTVVLEFPGTPHPAVSSLAIQWDRQGSYVWKIVDNVAHRTAVQIVQRRSGVVTVAGELKEGDRVVTEGVLRLRDGATVTEGGGSPGNAGAAGSDTGGGAQTQQISPPAAGAQPPAAGNANGDAANGNRPRRQNAGG